MSTQTTLTTSTTPFSLATGQVWHVGAITSPGQFQDFFLPLHIGKDEALMKFLAEQRDYLIEEQRLLEPSLEIAPNASWNYDSGSGGYVLKLKWKPIDVEKGRTVVVNLDNTPCTDDNRTLTDASLKVSFNQVVWVYEGRVGTKLKPRKIQVQAHADLTTNDEEVTINEGDSNADF